MFKKDASFCVVKLQELKFFQFEKLQEIFHKKKRKCF
jgi:hypothetical protein